MSNIYIKGTLLGIIAALLVGVPIGVALVLTTDNSYLSTVGVAIGVILGQQVSRRYISRTRNQM